MFTRKCLFEEANAIFCRNLAVTLHAMWRTNTPFRQAKRA
jgi:hypothetical protein